jgi:hypothetical protein
MKRLLGIAIDVWQACGGTGGFIGAGILDAQNNFILDAQNQFILDAQGN